MRNSNLEIGKTIAQLRKAKKMTQEDLAHHLGITNQAVSKWESGLNYPEITFLPILADLFEIPIDILFGRDAPNLEIDYVPTLSEIPPWPDDEGLYGVLYHGHRLIAYPNGPRRQESVLEHLYHTVSEQSRPVLVYSGNVSSISSIFDVHCIQCTINGPITAAGNLFIAPKTETRKEEQIVVQNNEVTD